MCCDAIIMLSYTGANLEISEGVSGSLELQLQPSCKLKTKKKGHYVVLNAVKMISKAKV